MRGEDDTLKKLSSSPAELRPQTHREIQLLRFVLGAEEAEEDGEAQGDDGAITGAEEGTITTRITSEIEINNYICGNLYHYFIISVIFQNNIEMKISNEI